MSPRGTPRLEPILPFESPGPDASFTSLLDGRRFAPRWDFSSAGGSALTDVPEGTTVLALRYDDGVVMAGDRQATRGQLHRPQADAEGFPADEFSAVAIAGTAGLAIEMVRLFQVELEHYEKIEGTRLSLEGKAAFLARLVRNQLPMAFQGLAVVPLFCGFDESAGVGALYSYDVVGGRYEEKDFATTGSGGPEARAFLKARYRPGLDEGEALGLAVEALVAAAEEDAATGGPDVKRGIYANVVTVTATGLTEIDDGRLAGITAAVLEARP